MYVPVKSAFWNVWSAASLQARNEDEQLRSARIYTALLEYATTPGQNGMRFALLLFNFAVLKDPFRNQADRATVRPRCHLFFASRPGRKLELLKIHSRRWSADVGIAPAISKPGFVQAICRPVRLQQACRVWVAGRLRSFQQQTG